MCKVNVLKHKQIPGKTQFLGGNHNGQKQLPTLPTYIVKFKWYFSEQKHCFLKFYKFNVKLENTCVKGSALVVASRRTKHLRRNRCPSGGHISDTRIHKINQIHWRGTVSLIRRADNTKQNLLFRASLWCLIETSAGHGGNGFGTIACWQHRHWHRYSNLTFDAAVVSHFNLFTQ